jgi:GTP pyrophosphokinase
MNVNIHKLTISCDDGIFDGTIEFRVHDREDVKVIMTNLKKIKGVEEIAQIK